jgi:hypothetical protein
MHPEMFWIIKCRQFKEKPANNVSMEQGRRLLLEYMAIYVVNAICKNGIQLMPVFNMHQRTVQGPGAKGTH